MKVKGTILKFGAENFLAETIFSDCEIDIPEKVPFLSDFHSRKVIGYAEVVKVDEGLMFTGEITDPDAIEMLATTHTMGCGGHYNCVERNDLGRVVKMKLVEASCVCAPVNPEYTFEIVDESESSIDDTIKLIIEIPTDFYEITKAKVKKNMTHTLSAESIANGIPLNDVKEQMKKARRFHVGTFEDDNPIDHGIVEGIDKAIAILDNVGKAKSGEEIYED